MTIDGAQTELPQGRFQHRALNPLLAIRAVQVVLWMLVISGPVAAVLVANQVSSIGDRLDTLSTRDAVEVPPDTSGVEGFAELFIAAYLGAGEDSIGALDPFLDDVALDGVEAVAGSALGPEAGLFVGGAVVYAFVTWSYRKYEELKAPRDRVREHRDLMRRLHGIPDEPPN